MLLPESAEIKISQQPHLGKHALASLITPQLVFSGDVGAVVGSKEYRRLAEIVRNRKAAERNRRNHCGLFFIHHKNVKGPACRCVRGSTR
jgi:hypothetical protein